MQKTTRLVVLSRKALLGILMMCSLAVAWPTTSAFAQETEEDQWGEKTPPKNYVRSKAPSKDGNAYNWKQMAYAGALMCLMGLGIVVLIRRAKREQDEA